MNGIQKVIKVFAICLAIIIIINIFGWIIFGLSCFVSIGEMSNTSATIEEERKDYVFTKDEYQGVSKIDIDIAYAELNIQTEGEVFTVQTNKEKEKIKVEVKDGTLKIREESNWFWTNNVSGIVNITLPEDMYIEKFKLDTGAGKVKINGISAKEFDINHGAGKLEIANCKFEKTDIDGGAGEINISSSVLNNLKLDAGIRQSRDYL